MARIRTVKPELASSKKLATISRDARLTLVLLITQADDHGFVLGEPRQLLGNLYPHDEDVTQVTLERWVRELVSVGSIVLRESKHGERVVQVVGWHEHQRITKPSRSKIEPTLTEEVLTLQNFVEKNSTNFHREVEVEVEVEVEEGSGRGKKEVEEGITTPLSPPAAKVSGGGWPAVIADAWTRTVGIIQPGRVGKDLLPFVRLYPSPAAAESALVAAVRIYDDTCTRRSQSPKWAQFVAGVQGYVPQNQLPPTRREVA